MLRQQIPDASTSAVQQMPHTPAPADMSLLDSDIGAMDEQSIEAKVQRIHVLAAECAGGNDIHKNITYELECIALLLPHLPQHVWNDICKCERDKHAQCSTGRCVGQLTFRVASSATVLSWQPFTPLRSLRPCAAPHACPYTRAAVVRRRNACLCSMHAPARARTYTPARLSLLSLPNHVG